MRYCSDAIAIAQLANIRFQAYESTNESLVIPSAIILLDAAERELRHNINHAEVPPDCSDETFGVEPVRKEK